MIYGLDLSEDQCIVLLAYLKAQPDILQAWAIGSRAIGRAREDSDLDLTVRLADPAVEQDWHTQELTLLIDHSARWAADLTEALGIVVKDILLEYDPGRVGDRQGRDKGILLLDRIGQVRD